MNKEKQTEKEKLYQNHDGTDHSKERGCLKCVLNQISEDSGSKQSGGSQCCVGLLSPTVSKHHVGTHHSKERGSLPSSNYQISEDSDSEQSERTQCCEVFSSPSVIRYLLPLSIVLNIILGVAIIIIVLLFFLLPVTKDENLQSEYNSSRETLADTVCMPCKGFEQFVPWEKWRYTHMDVLKSKDEDLCCFHRSNYLQILIKLINFAQRRQTIGERRCHSIINSHFNVSGGHTGHPSTLALAEGGINYGSNTQGPLEIHNGIVRIDKSDHYQLYLQITVRFDHRESSSEDFHLHVVRQGAKGTNSTLLHRQLQSGKSSEGIDYRSIYILEMVSLEEGDRVSVIVDNQSLMYKAYECNSVGLIGS